MRDYRDWLDDRKAPRVPIERTPKRPGEYEFVWKDGRYQAVRIGEGV